MVLKINPDHATIPHVPNMTWDFDTGQFIARKREGDKWQQVAVTKPFAIDVWCAQHGWEAWQDADGKKSRRVVMAPVSDELPAKPGDDYKPLYTVPVNGTEIGQRELLIKGIEVTASFVQLLENCAAAFVDGCPLPIVETTAKDTDYGRAPTFEVIKVVPRPSHWRTPIVSFV